MCDRSVVGLQQLDEVVTSAVKVLNPGSVSSESVDCKAEHAKHALPQSRKVPCNICRMSGRLGLWSQRVSVDCE